MIWSVRAHSQRSFRPVRVAVLLLAILGFLVPAQSGPVGAQSSQSLRSERERVAAERAEAAASIDALKAEQSEVVAALDEDSGAPGGGDVIMADVHGVKYGEFWASPVAQMWAAAADHDSVGRARGALRFGRTDRDVARPLVGLTPTVLDWASPPPPYTATALRRHIPERWDEGLGVRNMEGASAVAAGMRLLEGDASPLGRLDEVMRALNASYSHHLDTFLPPSEVAAMVKGLAAAGRTAVRASVVTVPAVTAESLRTALVDAGCGEEGVAVLASYEFNRAYGSPLLAKESGEAGALSHGTRAWSVIAAVDAAADGNDVKGVVIAPSHHVIVTGRLWATSMERLAVGMAAVSEGGTTCSLWCWISVVWPTKRQRWGGRARRPSERRRVRWQ